MTPKLLFLATIGKWDLMIAGLLLSMLLVVIGVGVSSDICRKLDEIKDVLTKKDK